MSTKYWSDPPCQSGEEFARCSEPDIPQSDAECPPSVDKCRPAKPDDMTQAEYDEQYPRSNYRCYTSPICTQEACKCMMTCCKDKCPKSVCLKDTHGSCELKDRGTCPMWPQCIINGELTLSRLIQSTFSVDASCSLTHSLLHLQPSHAAHCHSG